MKLSYCKIILLMISASMLYVGTSCRSSVKNKSSVSQNASASGVADEDYFDESEYELPLPSIPVTITDPRGRAAYLLNHFWDECDFGDTLRSLNPDFVEINFVNFINVFPHADNEAVRSAVERLMKAAEVNAGAFGLLAETAESYLYDPNSPFLDEEYFIIFLEQLLKSDTPDQYEKLRYEMILTAALKNRPGTKAADFTYATRNGSVTSLYKTPVKDLLLVIFYDPECDHCKEIIAYLHENEYISEYIANGTLKILAVYADGDRILWEHSDGVIPSGWTDGFDTGRIAQEKLYVLRAAPTLYLLDSDKNVIFKDMPPVLLARILQDR